MFSPKLPIIQLIIGLLLLLSTPLAAQEQLKRISVAARGDGQGYVVRLHEAGNMERYQLTQPTNGLVQVELRSPNAQLAADFEVSNAHQAVDDISAIPLTGSIGINIFLAEGVFFEAQIYPDGSRNDLLINLKKSSKDRLAKLTKGVELKEWSVGVTDLADFEQEPLPVDPFASITEPGSNGYDTIREKVKFDVVVIDPGHGGKDPGALGYRKTKESEIALAVALKLGNYIKKYLPDVKVVYTRDDDTFIGLKERGQIANKAEGDLFISLHCNAFRKRNVIGTEVYFLGMHRSDASKEVMLRENSVVQLEMETEQKLELTEEDLAVYELMHSGFISSSQQFAFAVDQQFTQRVQRPSRGVKQAGFVVLWHTAMPAVLVELGFISNPTEEQYLRTEYGQTMLASGLFRAVRDYKVALEKNQHLTEND